MAASRKILARLCKWEPLTVEGFESSNERAAFEADVQDALKVDISQLSHHRLALSATWLLTKHQKSRKFYTQGRGSTSSFTVRLFFQLSPLTFTFLSHLLLSYLQWSVPIV